MVKRAYDQPEPSDGLRLLVDRLWPRGLNKETAALDGWLRDVAPSHELRRWYGHDPSRFTEFADRYRRELGDQQHAAALARLLSYARTEPVITLVTATRDLAHAHTAVLDDLIEHHRATTDPGHRPTGNDSAG
jgi:uncharacterized protein YeaO (DUF488 family)